MNFSIEELSIIALLLDQDEKKEKKDTGFILYGSFETPMENLQHCIENWWTTNSNFMNILE
jgi:hypothetical protein